MRMYEPSLSLYSNRSAKLRKPKPEVELRCPGCHLKNGYDVITLSRMVRFGRTLVGRCRMICLPRLLDVHFEDAQTGLVHAPKHQILMKKSWRFTTSYKDDCNKIAELKKTNITKDDISSQHSDNSATCCEVIISFVMSAVLVLRFWCRRPYKML